MPHESFTIVHANKTKFIVDRRSLADRLKKGSQMAKDQGLRPGQVDNLELSNDVSRMSIRISMEKLFTLIVTFSEGQQINK